LLIHPGQHAIQFVDGLVDVDGLNNQWRSQKDQVISHKDMQALLPSTAANMQRKQRISIRGDQRRFLPRIRYQFQAGEQTFTPYISDAAMAVGQLLQLLFEKNTHLTGVLH
jgi:hypothetical protein